VSLRTTRKKFRVTLRVLPGSWDGSVLTIFPMIFTFLLWFLLLVLCWPVALLLLVLWPVLWLLSIPFRIVGVVVEALLAFVRALLFLPARVLGHRER
jgi:hypothetical protein